MFSPVLSLYRNLFLRIGMIPYQHTLLKPYILQIDIDNSSYSVNGMY